MTTTAVGKQLSERRPSDREIRRWADATADMLTGYLAGLSPRGRKKQRVAVDPAALVG